MPRLRAGTPWEQFRDKWKDCSLCHLCGVRHNVVLCKGAIPCDILFVGEGPGTSEDAIGKPFIGPAGKLLEKQIGEAQRNAECDFRFCFTNLVCCIPKERGKKVGEPPKACIEACSTRLEEFLELCKPRAIISVGDLSETYLGERSYEKITHPAAILRAEIVRQELMYHKVVVVLENVFRDLKGE